jgi:phosphate transport system permease protein
LRDRGLTETGPKLGSEHAFTAVCLVAMGLPLLVLLVLFGDVFMDALPRLSWDFMTSYPSRKPEEAASWRPWRAALT